MQYLSHDDLPKRLPDVLFPEFVATYLHRHNQRHHFDVIDASTGDAWVWGTMLRRFAPNQPLLVTRSHGLEHTVHLENLEEAQRGNLSLSWKYPLYRGSVLLWEVARSLRCADRVFLLNRQDQKYAIKVLGVQPDRIAITPNGIPDQFLNLPLEPLIDAENAKLRIVCIGTYIPRKGIHYSIPALNCILDRYPHVSVSFLGTCCPEAQVHADFDVAVRDRDRDRDRPVSTKPLKRFCSLFNRYGITSSNLSFNSGKSADAIAMPNEYRCLKYPSSTN